MNCQNCKHFIKEKRKIEGVEAEYNTWINYSGTEAENPGQEKADFALCENEETQTIDVERSELTAWFFNNKNYIDLWDNAVTVVVSEHDTCPNFEPIEEEEE
jgi:hypothetical protein